MSATELRHLERRLLVLAPTGKDAPLTASVLREAELECTLCADFEELGRELERGAAVLLIAEEAIPSGGGGPVAEHIAGQAPWSDLPVLVITRQGADSAAAGTAIQTLGNVTLLERPTRVTALVSAVRTALRAREKQYQIRAHLLERERAAEDLKETDRRKDEFLAILAHELRNPLAPLRNSLQILRITHGQNPVAEEAREIMERQVNQMVHLVDDLMEVSRITRGRIDLRTQRVEIAAVVRSAVETSQPLIDAAHHQLSLEIPPQPLFVEGDPVRLVQIFSNLLNNAARYTDDSGRISLTVRRENRELVVAVRDTGVGIPPEMLPRVFDLFTQVDPVLRRSGRNQGGLGIGLTLVRTLVEMHGGSVEARSAGPRQGSEFRVRLPLAASPSGSRGEPRNTLSASSAQHYLNLVGTENAVARPGARASVII
jgi:signal transduction histidine kinase